MKQIISFIDPVKSIRYALAFALLFAVGSVGFYACTNKDASIDPSQSTQTTKRNKDVRIYSNAVVTLSQNQFFKDYFDARDECINIPFYTIKNISATNRSAFEVAYDQLETAMSQNPTEANEEAIVRHIGYINVREFNSKISTVYEAKNILKQNYGGFIGLTESQVDVLIGDAVSYTESFENLPPDLVKYKGCMGKAADRLNSAIKVATSFTAVGQALGTFRQDARGREYAYGPNSQ